MFNSKDRRRSRLRRKAWRLVRHLPRSYSYAASMASDAAFDAAQLVLRRYGRDTEARVAGEAAYYAALGRK